MQNIKLIFTFLITFILVSCGGGGGGGGGGSEGGGSGGSGGYTNTAPSFVGLMDYAIDENTTAVTTVQATDAQGDAITYRIIGQPAI